LVSEINIRYMNKDRSALLNQLTQIFRIVLENDSLILKEEFSANDVENWNSLSHMLIINKIEERFNFKFRLKELNKMRNVGDMLNIVESKL